MNLGDENIRLKSNQKISYNLKLSKTKGSVKTNGNPNNYLFLDKNTGGENTVQNSNSTQSIKISSSTQPKGYTATTNTSSEILSSQPVLAEGDSFMAYGTDSNSFYINDGENWFQFESDS